MAPDSPATALRVGGLVDVPAIVAVQARSWRESYRGLVDDAYLDALPLQDWIASWRAQFFSARDRTCLLAEAGGRVVGFASAGPPGEPEGLDPSVGELHTLYVEAAHQGAGLGRLLLERALDHLRDRGYITAVLWVLEGNARGIRFYEAAGWTPDGARASDCWGATNLARLRYRRAL
jgi:GNAT superfamily N-acetyltransferase